MKPATALWAWGTTEEVVCQSRSFRRSPRPVARSRSTTGPRVLTWIAAAIAAFSKPHDSAWRGLERLIEHAWEEWQRQPRHRDPIFARDGWRCAAPACSSRLNLHDHHLLFRSRGGGNARQNRFTVCAWQHLRGIHQGRVRAWGTAPDDVTWELGVRPGRAPLLRLHGDVYVGAG